jgi:hypothetical protein
MKNIKLSYESFEVKTVSMGLGLGEGLGAGAGFTSMIIVDIINILNPFTYQIAKLVEKFGIDSIKPLHEAGVKFSDLHSSDTAKLVEKFGIDSIKPLHEAGVKFSDLHSFQIVELVEKYGVEIKDKLLHPENIQVEIIADDIYIENLVDNSMGQIEKDEYLDYSAAMEIESAYTTIYDTDTFEG